MRRNFLSEAQKYIAKNRRRRIWKDIVIVLACIVVFCTTYALILPAITVEQQDVNQVVGDAEYQSDTGNGNDSTTEGSGTTGQNSEGIDFTNWITNVTYNDSNGGSIEQWDTLSFKINYEVPGEKLSANSEQSRTIVYTLPTNMKVTNDSSGNVYDGKTKVGTYSISRETGKITIIFDPDYAEENNTGKDITGSIEFDAKVSELGDGRQENVQLVFNQDNIIDININTQAQQTNDLKVQKTASEITNGIITYTITVSSENGTGSTVVLKDIMDNVSFGTGESGGSGFEVIRKNGHNSEKLSIDTPTIDTTTGGKETFDLTLPQMNAGDQYIIEYKAKIEDVVNGTINTNNKVTVNSTNKDGEKLTNESSIDKEFTNELIKKTYQEKDGMIEWTIDINKSKQDISGWTLSDKLNNVALPNDVEVTISPSPKTGSGSLTTHLPFTFTQDMITNESYKVTYRTEIVKGIENSTITNEASFKPFEGGGDGYSSTKEVAVGSFNPLKKQAIGITEDNDDTSTNSIEADIEWKVTIDTTEGEIPAGWVFEDSLENGQWLTTNQQNQINAIFENLKKNGYPNELEWETKSFWVDGVEKKDVVAGFKVTFTNALNKGDKIEFSYKSTGSINNGYTSVYFSNNININEKVYSSASTNYNPEPVVSKYDLDGNKTDNTTHNFNDINGTLGWGFTVDIPNRANGKEVIITETLPNGLSLLEGSEGLKVIYNDTNYSFTFEDGSSISELNIDGQKVTATKSKDNNNNDVIIINIPNTLTTGDRSKQFKFEIRTKLDDNYDSWTLENYNYKANFQNKVTVETKNGDKTTEIGKDEQTQTIIKESEQGDVLAKSHGNAEYNNIPYSIVVNPNGTDLLEDSDTLILKDELRYGKWLLDSPNNVDVSLKPGSFHIYDYENGQKGEELSANEFQYTITTEIENNSNVVKRISITIPDSRALLVEYEYNISGNFEWNITIQNTSFLEGESIGSNSSQSNITLRIDRSSAIVSMKGINIYKVDSSNYKNTLPGAEFKLYRWSSDGNKYVPVENKDNTYIFKTNEDGKFLIDDIAYDTAYKLVETKAPEGYKIQGNGEFEFYVADTDSNVSKPDNFNGTKYMKGSDVYIENRKDSTDITVEKKWFDGDGNMIEGGKPGDIKFRLYQKVINTTTNEVTTRPYTNTEYILNQNVYWKKTIQNLPKRGTEGGQTVEYSYYVVEDELTNYKTEYEYTVDGSIRPETAENKGIVSGTITIKNTENVKYVLPETGVLGGDISFILGGMLLMAGSLVYIYKRKHKRV